jgi:hypothetical protein
VKPFAAVQQAVRYWFVGDSLCSGSHPGLSQNDTPRGSHVIPHNMDVGLKRSSDYDSFSGQRPKRFGVALLSLPSHCSPSDFQRITRFCLWEQFCFSGK